MNTILLAVLLAAPARAHIPGLGELGPSFEAARRDALNRAAPVAEPPSAPADELPHKSEPAPAELLAARARVGIRAQLARMPKSDGSFRFAVLGDAEPGRFVWQRVFAPSTDTFELLLAQVRAAGADFALQLGDFVSEGSANSYRAHAALLDRHISLPILSVIGNHDRSRPNGDASKDMYDALMGPRDYYFDHGDWRFIALDSSDRRLAPSQLAWLAKALEGPRRKVVYTHVPPDYVYKLRPIQPAQPAVHAHDETLEKRGAVQDFFTNYFKDGASRFEELVSNGGVAAVYMGHIHAFEAYDHRGVRYVISGASGSPLYPLPPGYPTRRFTHWLLVEAGPEGLRETVIPLKGARFALPPADAPLFGRP